MELKIAQSSEKAKVFASVHPHWPHSPDLDQHVKMRLESVQHQHATWFYLEVEGEVAASLGAYPFSFNVHNEVLEGIAIGAVFTVECFRGKGLAKKLIKQVEQHVQKQGAKLCILYSDIGYDFYQQLGYQRVSIYHGQCPAISRADTSVLEKPFKDFPQKQDSSFNCWVHYTDTHQHWIAKRYADSKYYTVKDIDQESHFIVGEYENETYILDWRSQDIQAFDHHACHLAKCLDLESLNFWYNHDPKELTDRISIPKVELPMIHWFHQQPDIANWHLQPIDHV